MKYKIGYWVTIGLFSLMMTGSAVAYLSGSAQMVEAFHHLGYPDYFRKLLGVAKLLGIAALLVPWTPAVLREWAYAGFVFTLLAAAISHGVSGDPVGRIVAPLVALALLVLARLCWHRAQRN